MPETPIGTHIFTACDYTDEERGHTLECSVHVQKCECK